MIKEILEQIPRGTPIYKIECLYYLIVLERNNGSRTKAAKELRVSLRCIRYRIAEMKVLGMNVPEAPKPGRPKPKLT